MMNWSGERRWSGNDVNMMPRYDNLKKKINFIFFLRRKK